MKKTKFLLLGLLMAFAPLFVSCSEDDDEDVFSDVNTEQGTESEPESGTGDEPDDNDELETDKNEDYGGSGKNAVDLGLSVKWASCNVDANSPEEYGGYYAWGETEEKDDYSWSTYKWYNGHLVTKYGTVDGKTTLDLEDDVAHVKWGGKWRMPTWDEIQELYYDCDWTWTSVNGVNGYKVTAPNGNSIFLPAAGYRDNDGIYGAGSHGNYWSSTNDDDWCHAKILIFYDYDHIGHHDTTRNGGYTVRPVCD